MIVSTPWDAGTHRPAARGRSAGLGWPVTRRMAVILAAAAGTALTGAMRSAQEYQKYWLSA
jgi:hypothetical protein